MSEHYKNIADYYRDTIKEHEKRAEYFRQELARFQNHKCPHENTIVTKDANSGRQCDATTECLDCGKVW